MERQSTTRQIRARRAARKRRNIIIISIEMLLLVMMIGILWFVTKFTDESEGVKRVEISENDIKFNDGIRPEETNKGNLTSNEEHSSAYRTIALFGLDSTTGELIKDTRSDTIMIAS